MAKSQRTQIIGERLHRATEQTVVVKYASIHSWQVILPVMASVSLGIFWMCCSFSPDMDSETRVSVDKSMFEIMINSQRDFSNPNVVEILWLMKTWIKVKVTSYLFDQLVGWLFPFSFLVKVHLIMSWFINSVTQILLKTDLYWSPHFHIMRLSRLSASLREGLIQRLFAPLNVIKSSLFPSNVLAFCSEGARPYCLWIVMPTSLSFTQMSSACFSFGPAHTPAFMKPLSMYGICFLLFSDWPRCQEKKWHDLQLCPKHKSNNRSMWKQQFSPSFFPCWLSV